MGAKKRPEMASKFKLLLEKNVDRELHRLNLDRNDLAEKMGITKQAVYKTFAGTGSVGSEKVSALADILGVSIATLLATDEERAKLDDEGVSAETFITTVNNLTEQNKELKKKINLLKETEPDNGLSIPEILEIARRHNIPPAFLTTKGSLRDRMLAEVEPDQIKAYTAGLAEMFSRMLDKNK